MKSASADMPFIACSNVEFLNLIFANASKKEVEMKCVICKNGETKPGLMTINLNRGDAIVIIKHVPAKICENCGEYYLDEATTDRVLTQAEDAVKKGAELEILRYAA
jgi:YgiT-type zinc finger domain-containing protein